MTSHRERADGLCHLVCKHCAFLFFLNSWLVKTLKIKKTSTSKLSDKKKESTTLKFAKGCTIFIIFTDMSCKLRCERHVILNFVN